MKLANSKILVVEDESIVATHIAETLKHSGYEVTDTVPSGEMALLSVGRDEPDLILMDIVLNGGMSGIEAAEKINARFDVPVIFLTAYSDKKTLDKAKNTGPFGFIVKPFKEKDLHSGIQVALQKHRQVIDLKCQEEWYKSSLKNLGEAVIAVDKNGNVVFINQAAEFLTGFTETKGIGKPVQDICSLENKTDRDSILKVIETGNPIDLRNNLILGKGKKCSVCIHVTAVREGKGNILGAVLVLHKVNVAGVLESENHEDRGNGKQSNFEEGSEKVSHTVNICPWCKKLFNEREDRWESIELYFKKSRPDSEFSHCICSECASGLGLFDPNKTK